MNTTPIMAAKFSIPFFAMATFFASAGGSTAHADTNIDCSVPLNVQCTISDPQGIQSITVQLHTALGTVNAVEETYSCVTSATVSWDPIVPNGDILVTTCGGILPPQSGRGYAEEAIAYNLRDGVIQRRTTGNTLDIQRPGINYLLRTPMFVVRAIGATTVRSTLQLLPFLDSYAPNTGGAALAESSYCCDEGTFDNCFGVNLLAQCGEGLDFVHCTETTDGGQDCQSFPN